MTHTKTGSPARDDCNLYRQAIVGARPALGGVILFSALLNVLMLTGSIYMLQVYDRVLPGGSVPTLIVLFGIVVILFAFLGFYDFLRARLLSRIALRLDDRLSAIAFCKWLDTGLPDTREEGATQVMRDLDTVRGFVSGPVIAAMADLLFVPLFLGVLFLIHPWLGFLTIAGAGVGGLIALTNRAVTKKAIRQSAALDNTERNFTERSRRNVEAIHAMGMHNAVSEHWRALHHASLASAQKGSDPSEMLAAASRAFRMLLQSAILTLGAFLVLRGEISAGMIIASSILSGRALAPVDQLIGQWRATGRFAAAHKRLITTFNMSKPAPRRIDLPSPTGQITVSELSKLGSETLNGDRAKVLNQVSFELSPGDALGVVGSSASGKSTLARMLVGAGEYDGGEIRFDGATASQWEPAQLGRQIGYLPQVVEMLPGTIGENIARFDPNASDADIIAAATLTGIHEMILKLPEGYCTRLGDLATSPLLSGGQIQRLGLARAVYRMPKIVVLDEPNANLDIAGDAALTHTIETLRAANSTVIVMAHRPSVLSAVNKLLILTAGQVGAFGDRDTMLAEDYRVSAMKPRIVAQSAATDHDEPDEGASEELPVALVARSKVVRMAGPTSRKQSA